MNAALATASIALILTTVALRWLVVEMRLRETRADLFYAERSEAAWQATVMRAEQALAAIGRQRSDTTRKGNITRRAAILARADDLRADIARRRTA